MAEIQLEISLSEDGSHLSIVDQNLDNIPDDLGEHYGPKVTDLALAFNNIKYATHLDRFTKLKTLTLDNNQLVARQNFPYLPTLETLNANNNSIESIEVFIEAIQDKFPNLKHLSLLRNPCCPNYFVGKDSASYQKYRYYVASRLPNLKYLDASPVTEKERTEGNKSYARVARPDPSQYQKKAEDPVIDASLALPADDPAAQQKKTTYGVTRYVYVGRQSEGNRFIVDQQL